MNKQRICIYPKDVQLITGKSERYGRLIIERIKKNLSKQKHQLVTINEFCNYTGIEEGYVCKFII